jgi:DNA invertase Pin-like site-specific DNA recombinase
MQQVVLFGRVSSTNERQSFERQINDLTQLATKLNYRVVSVFAEKISGATKNAARKELTNMIEFVNNNQIDKILVTALDRLGRDTLQVLQTIEILNQNKISLYIQNYNIETLTPEKQINPMSQFLITILAEVARMERKTIENRLASGYQNFRNAGGVVGRKVGFKKSDEVMKDQYQEEIKMLRKGYSFTHINQITQTNKNTLTKLKKLFID